MNNKKYLYYSIHAKKQNQEAVWNSFNRAAFNRQSRLPTRPWKCINLRPGAHSGLPTERYPGKLRNIIARCKNQSQERFRDQRSRQLWTKNLIVEGVGDIGGPTFFSVFLGDIIICANRNRSFTSGLLLHNSKPNFRLQKSI